MKAGIHESLHGESNPAGWNGINEHNDYANIRTWMPPTTELLLAVSDEAGSESSDEDLPENRCDEPTPAATDPSEIVRQHTSSLNQRL